MTRLSRALSRLTDLAACARFTPSDSGQRLPPTYYRSCWHVVSWGFLLRVTSKPLCYLQRPIHPVTQRFTTREPSSPRGVASSGFPHCEIFSTAASRRSFGQCLSPNVADHPLRPATHRRLGAPLPHQQANRTRAHLRAAAEATFQYRNRSPGNRIWY